MDVETGAQFKGHTNTVSSVVFSNDGEIIATESYDKTVILYRCSKESEEETKERFEKRSY